MPRHEYVMMSPLQVLVPPWVATLSSTKTKFVQTLIAMHYLCYDIHINFVMHVIMIAMLIGSYLWIVREPMYV